MLALLQVIPASNIDACVGLKLRLGLERPASNLVRSGNGATLFRVDRDDRPLDRALADAGLLGNFDGLCFDRVDLAASAPGNPASKVNGGRLLFTN